MIIRKTKTEIEKIASAGEILVEVLNLIQSTIKPGVTTSELDRLAEDYIRSHGAIPTFKGYPGKTPFPASLCTSRNAVIVHGLPSTDPLIEGDLLSVDCGVTLDGWIADAARTYFVGKPDPAAKKLVDVAEQSLHAAIEHAQVGNRVGDISHAVQQVVEAEGFAVVRELVGHGVGREMHEDPQIPNYGPPNRGPRLEEGMVLAIEPMITAGTHQIELTEDGWTIQTKDGSLAAHVEVTLAILPAGPRILTPWMSDLSASH